MKSEPDGSELFATQYSIHGVQFHVHRFLCVKTVSLEICLQREGGNEKKQTNTHRWEKNRSE